MAAEAAKKPGMEINRRLFALTGGREGVRGRIALAAVFGLLATATGVARLTVQGSVVAMVFAGVPFSQLAVVLASLLVFPVLRVLLVMSQEFVSYGTAARKKVGASRVSRAKVRKIRAEGRSRKAMKMKMPTGATLATTSWGRYRP